MPGSQIRRTDDSVQGLSGEFGTGTNYRVCSGTDDLEINGRRTDDSVRGLSGEFGTGTNYRECSGTDDLEINGRRTDDSVQGLLTSSVQNRNA